MRWTKKVVSKVLEEMGFSYSWKRVEIDGSKAWVLEAEKGGLKISAFGTSARLVFEDFLEKWLGVRE